MSAISGGEPSDAGGHLSPPAVTLGAALAARAVLENTAALILVIDNAGRVVLCNYAFQEVLGWSDEELLGRPFWDVFVLPGDVPHAQTGLRRQLDTRRGEIREPDVMTRDGGLRRISWHNSVLCDRTGESEFVVCVGIDVTERRQAEARLRERAETDALTGLLNRASLLDALEEQESVGVLFCDLDDFKPVNDRYGHAAGDHVLVEVADRLRKAVREHDLVARIGGDEFVVLSPSGDGLVLDRLAARVREAFTEPIPLPGRPGDEVTPTLSVGVAVRVPGEHPHAVLVAADAAMYQSKARSAQ